MTRPMTRLRGQPRPVNTYSGPDWEEKVVRGRNRAAPRNDPRCVTPQKPCNPIWSQVTE